MRDDRWRELDRQLEENEDEQRAAHKVLDDLEQQESLVRTETDKYLKLMDESRGWRGDEAEDFRRRMEAELLEIGEKARRDFRQVREQLEDRVLQLRQEHDLLQREKREMEED